jgi:hypothetical protein
MALKYKLIQIIPSIIRGIAAKNSKSYELILQYLRERKDIWTVPQGEFISWWAKRENADFKVTVSGGVCRINTSLDNAVIERFPGNYLDVPFFSCPKTSFSGDLWITIDKNVEKKNLLIELLKREGILNIQVDRKGVFIISQEDVGELLTAIEAKMKTGQVKLLEADVSKVRQIVINKLSKYHLPLLRIWYYPRIDGRVMQAVFSTRFDVDRAITNLPIILAIENKYGIVSTLYLRVFCPFYTDKAIKNLVSKPWCPEIALHGEFVTHAQKYGNEIKAAEGEKSYLEHLTKQQTIGVSMHGGEMAFNRSNFTYEAIQKAGFLYDTTLGPQHYYFPFKAIIDDKISQFYVLPHAISDVAILPFNPTKKISNSVVHKSYSFIKTLHSIKAPAVRNYSKFFFNSVTAKMDEIYKQKGVFVIVMHPIYFGFFSYLCHPKNWFNLFKFFLSYLRRIRH